MSVGDEAMLVDASGSASIPLSRSESLRGHIGLIDVSVDGAVIGEIEVVPDKLSAAAYELLRRSLDATWSGLVLDPTGVSRLAAGLPPARALWTRIERPVRDVLDRPREILTGGPVTRRLHDVRHGGELTPGLLRCVLRGAPGQTRGTIRTDSTPERAMVHETLRRLVAHARQTGDMGTGALIARLVPRSLDAEKSVRAITWGMRSDARYRQILDVHRILQRPELGATEGPGDLRLGIRALPRLYEYWVFLQVLLLAEQRYGPPDGDGYAALARRLPGRRHRLELSPGTTVTFPGSVHVAFEPLITSSGKGWMGIEYVPHPDPKINDQLVATPDVVVWREAEPPCMTIIDAKYVARGWVEREAARLHVKYARMRFHGQPVVSHVLAAHPHEGIDNLWAGYGSVRFNPERLLPDLPLPPPAIAPVPDRPEATSRSNDARPVVVVADQLWMHKHLGTGALT